MSEMIPLLCQKCHHLPHPVESKVLGHPECPIPVLQRRNQLPQGLGEVTQDNPSAQAKPSDRQFQSAKGWWPTGVIQPELRRKPSLASP